MSYLKTLSLFFFLALTTLAYAAPVAIPLQGYLGSEEIKKAEEKLRGLGEGDSILLVVNSSSGKLSDVIEFAKDVYALKSEMGTEVTVYIQENAVGPAAILPFLADQLFISYFVSWGDISLGTSGGYPTNLLRTTVKSLIPLQSPNRTTLYLMASAMSDPDLQVVDEGGWKIKSGDFTHVISKDGEALVVNHNQIKELGLAGDPMSYAEFEASYNKQRNDDRRGESLAKLVVPETLESSLKKHIVYDPSGDNTVGLIQINEKKSQISQATWIYVKKALDHYMVTKPSFVILELNTPGGEVFAAQKISDALKELDTQYSIPVVCFVNNWAISAGAMLAYSCRYISVTKDASMGAAEPIQPGEGGKYETAPEKVNSALRTDFANRARFYDRNPYIAEAMVDKDMVLVRRHGQIIKLDSEDDIRTSGADPDLLISAKGKLLTLNSDEMIDFKVADILLSPEKVDILTDSEKIDGSWPADKMLLFKAPFFKDIPNATIDLYQMDWKGQFLALLANPVVASLLFMGMLLGFYVEINSPGFGFAGSAALLCLSLIVMSSFALEIANTLEIVLVLVGIVFVALDLFLIPTFGILGVVGVIFTLIGLFGLMLPGIDTVDFEFDTQTFNAAGEVFIERLAWLCGSLIVTFVVMIALGRYVMPTFSGFQRLVLAGNEETKDAGYIAGAAPSSLPQQGAKGEVMATLRPSGKILINNEIHEAITSGEYIEKGTEVIVVKLDGSVIVVKEVEETP